MGVHFRDPLPRQWLRSIVNDPLLWSEKTKLKVQFLSQANYFKIIGESDTSSSVPQWSAKNWIFTKGLPGLIRISPWVAGGGTKTHRDEWKLYKNLINQPVLDKKESKKYENLSSTLWAITWEWVISKKNILGFNFARIILSTNMMGLAQIFLNQEVSDRKKKMKNYFRLFEQPVRQKCRYRYGENLSWMLFVQNF